MFSPVKAITAGALVFAIGGALLIAQPFGQPDGSVPGAATDAEAAAPVEVTGEWLNYDCNVSPDYCTQEWSMSDPRLEGTFKWFTSEWEDPDFNTTAFAYWAYVIENEGGTWRGLPDAWVRLPDEDDSPAVDMVFEGEGGYEGLTLIARFGDFDSRGYAMRGYIIDDAFPLPPGLGSTE